MTKQELRALMRDRCASFPAAGIARESAEACGMFLASGLYASASAVLSYIPLRAELDVGTVNRAAIRDGKTLAFPACVTEGSDGKARNTLRFYTVRPDIPPEDQVVCNGFCMEPDTSLLAPFVPGGSVCVLVPGLAFSDGGLRLGRGKGYYDGFLSDTRAWDCAVTRAGICFSFQLCRSVPAEEHDERVDVIFSSPPSTR